MKNLQNLFKNEDSYYMFIILAMDGKKRSKLLGISMKNFTDEKHALNWKNDMINKIEKLKKDENYNLALEKINQLYLEMI